MSSKSRKVTNFTFHSLIRLIIFILLVYVLIIFISTRKLSDSDNILGDYQETIPENNILKDYSDNLYQKLPPESRYFLENLTPKCCTIQNKIFAYQYIVISYPYI